MDTPLDANDMAGVGVKGAFYDGGTNHLLLSYMWLSDVEEYNFMFQDMAGVAVLISWNLKTPDHVHLGTTIAQLKEIEEEHPNIKHLTEEGIGKDAQEVIASFKERDSKRTN